MDNRRRSWADITADILEVTQVPSNKMRIMYRSNLNFDRFNRYFNELLRKGLIEEMNGADGRTVYKTTESGRTLLAVLKKAQEILAAESSSNVQIE